MRVVCDTNVLVSAFLTPQGPPASVLGLFLDKKIVFCWDSRIFSEYEEVLGRPKFKIPSTRIQSVLESIKRDGELINSRMAPIKLTDPDNSPFLEVALMAKADCLITGNGEDFKSNSTDVLVLSPARFLERYQRIANP